MSDVIETGALRKAKARGTEKARTKTMGKRAKIDRSKDELELGRFDGKPSKKTKPLKPHTAEESEVIGARRKKVTSDDAKAERRQSSVELEVATTRDVSKDAEPSRKRAKKRSSHSEEEEEAEGSWRNFAILILLSAVLVAISVAVFLLMPRYEQVGDPLIENPAFGNGLADWEQQGTISWDRDDPARVTLDSADAKLPTSLARNIELPEGDSLMMLRAQVRGEDVQPGPEAWDQARIYFAQVDDAGEVLWERKHHLFVLNGTTDVRNYSRAFSIPEDIKTARLAIEFKNATGRLTVSRLDLFEVERPISFIVAAACILSAWGVLVLYAAFKTLSGIQSMKIRAWLGVTFVLSIIALMLPSPVYEDRWREFIYYFGIVELDIGGIGHAVMFTVLALIVRTGRPHDPIWMHAFAWLLICVASEVMQLFTIGREPSLEDLVLDAVGVFAGLAIVELSQHRRRLRAA